MNTLFQHLINFIKNYETGALAGYETAPADPADLGDPLTQDEIDFVKKLKKEIEDRFAAMP